MTSTEARLDPLLARWEEARQMGHGLTPEVLCADCPELIEPLRAWIAGLEGMDTWLASATDANGDLAPPPAPALEPAIAELRGLRFLARGALGEVFLARDETLGREVAVKLIQRARAGDVVQHHRFLHEAEVTGRLEHPGIVPVYGRGRDAAGRPYYAMRRIEGQTLREAIQLFHGGSAFAGLDGPRRLAFRRLLSQFVSVCNTVAYAHSRGVIHRDLKPSNIMLGPYDETLVVDWGLAKRVGTDEALAESAAEASPSPSPEGLTATGALLGTPQYMSPEQARGAQAGLPADIFSLGVVLYEILTGKSPYDATMLGGAELLQAVRAAAVVPPRQRDPSMPRALEAICLKALAARPEDRYSSSSALADDVTKWLADEPVAAWREPLSIRARRWMRRHRTLVASTVAVFVFGAVGLAGFAMVLATINQELDRQRQVALDSQKLAREGEAKAKKSEAETKATLEFFQKKVLAAARPKDQQGGLGIDSTIRAAVDRAEPAIEKTFADQPAVEAAIRATLGETYRYLGLPELAIRQHERALALRRQSLGPNHPDTLTSINHLAMVCQDAGQLDRSISLHEQALKARRATLGEDHPDTLMSVQNLAVAHCEAGQLGRAISLHEQVLKVRRATLGEDHPDTLMSTDALAVAYHDAGQLDRAISLHERAFTAWRAKLGEDHPDTLTSMSNLALAYLHAGRLDRAIPLHERALRAQKVKLGEDHPGTITSMNNLAVAYRDAGQLDRAIPLCQQVLETHRAKLGEDHPNSLISMNNLAMVYQDAGHLDLAIHLFRQVLEMQRAKLGEDHPNSLISMNNLAGAYHDAGELDRAIPLWEKVLETQRAKLDEDHPDTLTSMSNLALAYQHAGRLDRAIPLHEQALKAQKVKLGEDHPSTLTSLNNLASAYQEVGHIDRAIALFEQALKARRGKLGEHHPHSLLSQLNLARAYLLDKPAWAEPLLREALAIHEKKSRDDWLSFYTRSLLGESLVGQQKYPAAELFLLQGYEGMRSRESKIPAPHKKKIAEGGARIVQLYDAWNKKDKAEEWRKKLGVVPPDQGFPADPFAR